MTNQEETDRIHALHTEAIRLMILFVGPPRTRIGSHNITDFYAGGWKFRLWSHSDGNFDVGCYHHEREISGPVVTKVKTVRVINNNTQPAIVEEVIGVLERATVLQRIAGA